MTIALGPDWTPSGTMNMLTEAKCAQEISNSYYNGKLSDKRIVQMMTVDAAKTLGVEDQIGSLSVDKKADILLLSGDRRNPLLRRHRSQPNRRCCSLYRWSVSIRRCGGAQ